MWSGIRQQWRMLIEQPPGERFLAAYDEQRRRRRARWIGPVFWVLGLLLCLIGLVLMPAPGPGMLIVLLGLSLIARESRRLALALDAAELRLHALLQRLRRAWRR